MKVRKPRGRLRVATIAASSLALMVLAACGEGSEGSGDEVAVELPNRIEIVVPGAAGGGGDVLARQLMQASKGIVDANIVVLNKPGAAGQTALQYCKSRPKDGSCLVHVTPPPIILSPLVVGGSVTSEDVRGVLRVQIDPTYVAVAADSPFNSIDDLIAAAKTSSDNVTIVGGAVGSLEFVLVKQLEAAAGFEASYIPYEGGATVGLDLAGGHSEVGIINASDNWELIDSGKLRLLAVARPERTDSFPDVPTLAESGYDVGELDTWRGFVVDKEVDDEIVAELNRLFKQAIETEQFKTYQESSGLLPGYLDHADLDALIETSVTDARALFEGLGLLK